MSSTPGSTGQDRPNVALLADWLEGRLDPPKAAWVAASVADGDASLRASVDWLQRFTATAEAMPLHTPPPLVRQRLSQHFDRWSKAKAILEQPLHILPAALMFDSRMDRPLAMVRGEVATTVVHQAFRADVADLVLDVHWLPTGGARLEGQVLPIEDGVSPVFEATARGPGVLIRAVDGDDLGRFALESVPPEADELRVSNGEIVIVAALDLRHR